MKGIKSHVEVLTQEEINKIHNGTLKVLERVGFKVPNDECLKICKEHGAVVDFDNKIVKVPSYIMEDILDKIRTANLNYKEDNKLNKIYGNISTQVFVVDYMTKTRRYGLLDDVLKGIALVEHLDNIPSYSAVTIPSDVPFGMTDIISYQMIYSYSKKDGGTYILTPTSAKYIIEMSEVMGKGIGYFLETVSPLQFRKESLEMALLFVKQGKPLGLGPMVIGGATGPITVAGTITLQNAEILASLFLIYALTNNFGGYGAFNHSMDLRTMICSFGSPNQAFFGIAAAQMAKFYGLTAMSNSGLSDALMPDFQCGFEKASTAIFSCLAGCIGIGAQGIVGADQGFSFEQLVIDNEWLDAYNYIVLGFEVNEETIATEIIENVGIAGNYISEEHTALYMRDSYWPSKLFNRDSFDSWASGNKEELLEKAHKFVEEKTKDYKNMQPVIDQSKFEELNYIVKCAKEEIVK
ncbi:trimethylamine methyltransferase family protein [Caldicellulosiruptoraceae bacterium PP1]